MKKSAMQQWVRLRLWGAMVAVVLVVALNMWIAH